MDVKIEGNTVSVTLSETNLLRLTQLYNTKGRQAGQYRLTEDDYYLIVSIESDEVHYANREGN